MNPMVKVVVVLCVLLLSVGIECSAGASTKLHHRFIVPTAVKRWYILGDSTSTYPDAADPTWKLPLIDQEAFACIRSYESHNHLVDGDGSQGWYQFTLPTWQAAREVLTGLPSTPNVATGDQQSEVAVWYFKRNGRFGVQWTADAYRCPGVFNF